MSTRHVSPQHDPVTRQRINAGVVAMIAAALVLAAFILAKLCGCDERATSAICLAAGVVGLALGAAVCR